MIATLVEKYKAAMGSSGATLQICGNSSFTKALERQCKNFGINYAKVEDTDPGYPIVVDRETNPGAHAGYDVDTVEYPACAEAISSVCEALSVEGKVVCLIGRGKAVAGLRTALERQGATVIQCHSKTETFDVLRLVEVSDFVINAAPFGMLTPNEGHPYIFIGITGLYENADITARDIGKLTTAILCYRVSRYGV